LQGTQNPTHRSQPCKRAAIANTRQTVLLFGQTKPPTPKRRRKKRKPPDGGFILRPSSCQLTINSATQRHYDYICNRLKKLIAISFLSIFLCANTEIGQLLKLPTLIHHYLEHHDDTNDDDHDISFIDFLKKHYNENDNHSDNAKHNHQNLPFKTIDCHAVNTVIAFTQQTVSTLQATSIISSKNVAFYTEQHYTSKSFGSIWQPPKIG
jgi:hypothetical protein